MRTPLQQRRAATMPICITATTTTIWVINYVVYIIYMLNIILFRREYSFEIVRQSLSEPRLAVSNLSTYVIYIYIYFIDII